MTVAQTLWPCVFSSRGNHSWILGGSDAPPPRTEVDSIGVLQKHMMKTRKPEQSYGHAVLARQYQQHTAATAHFM